MADAVIIFIAFVLVLTAVTAAALMIRSARQRAELTAGHEQEQLAAESDYLDSYRDRLDQAKTVTDIERLEHERKSRRWDGSSSQ